MWVFTVYSMFGLYVKYVQIRLSMMKSAEESYLPSYEELLKTESLDNAILEL